MKETLPEYRCCNCGHGWEADGPYTGICPACGHIYYEWVNYTQWREARMKDEH